MLAITGASGFVGGHVLRACANQAVGLSRTRAPGCRLIERWDRSHLARALDGVASVVHAASVVHDPAMTPAEYTRFNVDGTRVLLQAAREAGVTRFVFISSIKVNGERSLAIDENTPISPELDYARTKAEAEKLVLEAADLNPVVLRLCPVYGRGDKGNVRTMIRAIQRRRFLVPGNGSARKSIVHVSTVVGVVRAVTAKPDARGVYVVADRDVPSIRELADAIALALGRRRPLSIPAPLLAGAAAIVGTAAHLMGVATNVSADLIRKAQAQSVCDPSRAIRELGVSCHVDLQWALRDEIEWLRSERLL